METKLEDQRQPVVKSKQQKPKAAWKKPTARVSRWLHIYLSMLSFIVLLFFSITGITLNHTEWFDGKQVEKKIDGVLPAAWVNNTDTTQIKKLEIVELLRSKYGVKGYVSDFLIQDDQCSISFKAPGYAADAFVNRADGRMQLTEIRLGLVAVMNDLHKGRDSGSAWRWVIDISAGFLVLVSLSGLIMLCFMRKKRMNGLLLGVLGGLICWLIYYFLIA